MKKISKKLKTNINKHVNNKGITLIALIITIIIMLILVAVTIDITVDGKLFDKAQEAVDQTNDKVGVTQNRVDELMDELDKIESGADNTGNDEKTVTFYVVTSTGTTEYTVNEGTTWDDFLSENTDDTFDGWWLYNGGYGAALPEETLGCIMVAAAGPVCESTGTETEGPWIFPDDPIKNGITYDWN